VTTKFQKGNRKGNMFETRAKFFSCGDERAVRRRRLKNIVRWKHSQRSGNAVADWVPMCCSFDSPAC